ncbi:MAG TPA: hypothetical protein VNF51_00200 [Candidatus Paceibacterota bacterium]|nr:hypothetical protein [Candidatus Paceibacterota bacterium]
MRNFHLPLLSICAGTVGVLLVVYIGLIAVVMSYAALTVEFSQSVKNDEAAVAVLETQYLASVESITNTNYLAEGYAIPIAQIFVPARSVTALR